MQPASKPKSWKTQTVADPSGEPPTKIQAIELPEAESDEEYETVPKKSRNKSPPNVPGLPEPVVPIVLERPSDATEAKGDEIVSGATDDDWLRSRTNRLLDLIDPSDILIERETPKSVDIKTMVKTAIDTSEPKKEATAVDDEHTHVEENKPDLVLEAIKSNGRLFVRNLPYTASEEDLREYFAQYGTLEEVCRSPQYCYFLFGLRDEYPDRDSLCFEHMM